MGSRHSLMAARVSLSCMSLVLFLVQLLTTCWFESPQIIGTKSADTVRRCAGSHATLAWGAGAPFLKSCTSLTSFHKLSCSNSGNLRSAFHINSVQIGHRLRPSPIPGMGSHFLEVHDVHSAHMVEMMGAHHDFFT